MSVKISHTADTKFYWKSGLQMPRRFLPSGIAIKFFINKMVEKAFLEVNPYRSHRCTATCGRIANMIIGNRPNLAIRECMNGDMADLVVEFEDLLEKECFFKRGLGSQRIRSIAIMFVPCAKKLEILDSAIYL